MAVAILISSWMYDELTYNKYHQNYERLTQVMCNGSVGRQGFDSASLLQMLKAELRNKYGSNFKHVSMASWNFGHILAVAIKK